MLATALALAPGVAFAQGTGGPPPAPKESAPVQIAPQAGGVERPVRAARPSRSVPSSGGSGGVGDFFGSDQAGGTSLTRESGGVDKSGAPNTQSSGQSGSPYYPY